MGWLLNIPPDVMTVRHEIKYRESLLRVRDFQHLTQTHRWLPKPSQRMLEILFWEKGFIFISFYVERKRGSNRLYDRKRANYLRYFRPRYRCLWLGFVHHRQSCKACPLTDRAPSFTSVLDRRSQFPRKWWLSKGDNWTSIAYISLVGSFRLTSRTSKTRQTCNSWPNGRRRTSSHPMSCQSCNLCANEGSKALTNFLSRPARRPLRNM